MPSWGNDMSADVVVANHLRGVSWQLPMDLPHGGELRLVI